MNVHSLSNLPSLDLPRPRWPPDNVAKSFRPADDWDASVLENFPSGQRYLIGVSGGRDSIALLHWLLAKGYKFVTVSQLIARDKPQELVKKEKPADKPAQP